MIAGYYPLSDKLSDEDLVSFTSVVKECTFNYAQQNEIDCGRLKLKILQHSSSNESSRNSFFENNEVALYLEGRLFGTKKSEDISSYYTKNGINKLLDHLNGEFSLIFLDKKSNQLFLACDHIGTVPLAYWRTPAGIIFSNDAMSLSKVACSKDGIEPAYVKGLFSSNTEHYSNTPHASVHKVLPAHLVEVTASDNQICYWDPSARGIDKSTTFEQTVKEYSKLLENAVEQRVTKHMASHMSGGLDSTLMASMSRKYIPKEEPFFAFSWSPLKTDKAPKNNLDERTLILKQCDKDDITPVFTDYNLEDYMKALNDWKHPLDFPYEHTVLKNACKLGVRTIVSGFGADEFIGLPKEVLYYDLFRRMSVKKFFTLYDKKGMIDRLKHLVNDGLFPLRRRPNFKGKTSQKLLKYLPDWGDNTFEVDAYKSPRHYMMATLSLRHIADRCASWYLLGQQNGIRYTYPFLDKELIEYCFRLETAVFAHGDMNKPIIRSIAKDYLIDAFVKEKQYDDPVLIEAGKQLIIDAGKALLPELKTMEKNTYLSLFDFKKLDQELAQLDQNDPKSMAEINYLMPYLKIADATTRGLDESIQNEATK